MRRQRQIDTAPGWGRGKLLAVLVAGAVALLAAVVGLGLGVYYSVLAGVGSGADGSTTVGPTQ